MDIEGVNLDFKPSLFEIAQEITNYDLVKLIMNRPGFKESLSKVTDNECYLHNLLTKVNIPIVTMGLFTIPGVVICEQYKMIIFNDIIQLLHAKRNKEAFRMH